MPKGRPSAGRRGARTAAHGLSPFLGPGTTRANQLGFGWAAFALWGLLPAQPPLAGCVMGNRRDSGWSFGWGRAPRAGAGVNFLHRVVCEASLRVDLASSPVTRETRVRFPDGEVMQLYCGHWRRFKTWAFLGPLPYLGPRPQLFPVGPQHHPLPSLPSTAAFPRFTAGRGRLEPFPAGKSVAQG